MKPFRTFAAMLTLLTAGAAQAGTPLPPFENSILQADLATQAGLDQFQAAVETAGNKTMIYADWHLLHFMKSELFSNLLPESAPSRSEDEACAALANLGGGRLSLSSRVNPGNNHLLARMDIDFARLPAFTMLTCEQVIGTGEQGLRIRGFFYVPEMRIETAQEFKLVPLEVNPTQLPADFFK